MSKIKIVTDGIDSLGAQILMINDDGSEIPIPGIYELSLHMKVDEINKAVLKIRSYVDVDVISELTGIKIEGADKNGD